MNGSKTLPVLFPDARAVVVDVDDAVVADSLGDELDSFFRVSQGILEEAP